MTETAPNTPSVVERTRLVTAGAPVVGVHFLDRTAAFVLGEEAVLLVTGKTDEKRVQLDAEKAGAWLKKGAQPTDRVLRFLDKAGLRKRDARNNPKKALPGKKRLEREKAQADAAAKAQEAAAAAAAAPAEAQS